MLVEVPHERISPETLQRLVEELVTRDTTDYGESLVPLATKVRHVLAQLESGAAVIVFDGAAPNIVTADEWHAAQRNDSGDGA